jgi:hypothetical protein
VGGFADATCLSENNARNRFAKGADSDVKTSFNAETVESAIPYAVSDATKQYLVMIRLAKILCGLIPLGADSSRFRVPHRLTNPQGGIGAPNRSQRTPTGTYIYQF